MIVEARGRRSREGGRSFGVIRGGDGAAASASLSGPVRPWVDATLASPIRLAAPSVTAPNVGLQFTGQHAPQSFYLLRPGRGGPPPPGAPVQAERLQHLFRSAAGWPD